MPADLGFSDRAIGLNGAGIFFLGCHLFVGKFREHLIAERWSARRWIAGIMISWGILTVLMALHPHRSGALCYRAFLSVGAAGSWLFPAVVVYLTHWFRAADRAKAVAVFYAAMPLSYVIGSRLLATALLHWAVCGSACEAGAGLFILEGIPAIVLGVIAFGYLTDWPGQASWLPAKAPRSAVDHWRRLDREKRAKQDVRT